MPKQVCMGAMMSCSFGEAPSTLVVLPTNRVFTNEMPAATVMDHIPMVNVLTFGLCSAPTNPAVIAIIASSLGSVTKAPCLPATVEPWSPGTADVAIASLDSLNDSCTLKCLWQGEITFSEAGQVQTEVS